MSATSALSRFAAAAPWLAAMAVASFLSLGAYAAVQQELRGGADDPQVQLAEDAAVRLATGEAPGGVVPAGSVDVARSLAPWVAVADAGAGVLAASGRLHGAAPAPPVGVIAYAASRGGNRVTWQPSPGVRIALVVVPVRGRPGLVAMAGRSLREVEARVDRIGMLCLLAWAGAIGAEVCAWGLAAWGRLAGRNA